MLELGMHGICVRGEVSDGLPFLDPKAQQPVLFCRRELTEKPRIAMKKMDWTRKLTSRNFGLSIASFAAVLLAALGHKRGGCGADRFPDHGRSVCSGYCDRSGPG